MSPFGKKILLIVCLFFIVLGGVFFIWKIKNQEAIKKEQKVLQSALNTLKNNPEKIPEAIQLLENTLQAPMAADNEVNAKTLLAIAYSSGEKSNPQKSVEIFQKQRFFFGPVFLSRKG